MARRCYRSIKTIAMEILIKTYDIITVRDETQNRLSGLHGSIAYAEAWLHFRGEDCRLWPMTQCPSWKHGSRCRWPGVMPHFATPYSSGYAEAVSRSSPTDPRLSYGRSRGGWRHFESSVKLRQTSKINFITMPCIGLMRSCHWEPLQ